MSDTIIVKSEKRVPHSSNSANRLRREGKLPAVIYGPKSDPISITLDRNDFGKVFFKVGEHTVINIDIDGDPDKKKVLIRNYQIDPVKKYLTHIDFLMVAEDRKVKTNIPIRIVGNAKGVKVGGVLEQFMNYIKVKAFPQDLPHVYEVDVTGLDVLDSIKVKELNVKDGVEILNAPDQSIVGVVTSRVVKEGEEGAEGEEVTEGAEGEVATEEASE